MPSPYGNHRGVAQYYTHAALPRRYAYAWTGMPLTPTIPSYYRDVGADPTGPDAGWIETGDSIELSARYRKDLSGIPAWPVAMTMETGRRSVRNSGPEQGKMFDGTWPSLGQTERSAPLKVIAVLGGLMAAAMLLGIATTSKKRRR